MFILGSWMGDAVLEAFEALMLWAVEKVALLFNQDISDWNILEAIAFMKDSVVFVNDFMPIQNCLEILMAGFAAKTSVMLARHIIGWIPTVEG